MKIKIYCCFDNYAHGCICVLFICVCFNLWKVYIRKDCRYFKIFAPEVNFWLCFPKTFCTYLHLSLSCHTIAQLHPDLFIAQVLPNCYSSKEIVGINRKWRCSESLTVKTNCKEQILQLCKNTLIQRAFWGASWPSRWSYHLGRVHDGAASLGCGPALLPVGFPQLGGCR